MNLGESFREGMINRVSASEALSLLKTEIYLLDLTTGI